jgi:hypothetical protein
MRPVGYLLKQVANKPDWLAAPSVEDIYSLSGCISRDFADYINYWKHNGFWLFDSPSLVRAVALEHGISLEGLKLFYYEAYELQYDDEQRAWVPFEPEQSFPTDVEVPAVSVLEGFDVTSFSVGTSPECSPLSCNSCADEVPTNRHCLFPTFEAAKQAVESGRFANAEPGPYRIIAVHSIRDA